MREVHGELFKSPFFDTKNDQFILRVMSCLTPVKLKKNEFLWKKNDISNYIVFITRGKIFMMMDN